MRFREAFATPVVEHDLELADRICPAITRRLTAEWEAGRPSDARPWDPWTTPFDLATRGDPFWDAVAAAMIRGVREAHDLASDDAGCPSRDRAFDYRIQLWGLVIPHGGHAAPHDHPPSFWAAVLYADAGDDDPAAGGNLALLDPRRIPATTGGAPLFPLSRDVRPKTGRLVVFPGWLVHYVHPYRGLRPRISVAANVYLDPR